MKLPVAITLVALVAVDSRAGDLAAGKLKALACQACHASTNANAPHLVGQREAYVVKQLTAFKSGDRKNDLMSAIAKQLSDVDIADLAAYWSAQPTGSDASVSDAVVKITKPRMTLPKDFPKGFVVYSTENDAEHHTTSKSYANATALVAAKAGKPLPDGSAVIVVNYTSDNKATSYSGMEARAGWGTDVPPLLQNGDWSYNLWTADRTPKPDVNQAVCLACHKPAAASSYVFTLDKIKASH
jgi:cytochrome c553